MILGNVTLHLRQRYCLNDFLRDTANHGCLKRMNIIRSRVTSDSPYAMGRFKCLSRN